MGSVMPAWDHGTRTGVLVVRDRSVRIPAITARLGQMEAKDVLIFTGKNKIILTYNFILEKYLIDLHDFHL